MVALTRENEAVVALAEAHIPQAIADAFRSGQLRAGQKNRRRTGFVEPKPRTVCRTVDTVRSTSAFIVRDGDA